MLVVFRTWQSIYLSRRDIFRLLTWYCTPLCLLIFFPLTTLCNTGIEEKEEDEITADVVNQCPERGITHGAVLPRRYTRVSLTLRVVKKVLKKPQTLWRRGCDDCKKNVGIYLNIYEATICCCCCWFPPAGVATNVGGAAAVLVLFCFFFFEDTEVCTWCSSFEIYLNALNREPFFFLNVSGE